MGACISSHGSTATTTLPPEEGKGAPPAPPSGYEASKAHDNAPEGSAWAAKEAKVGSSAAGKGQQKSAGSSPPPPPPISLVPAAQNSDKRSSNGAAAGPPGNGGQGKVSEIDLRPPGLGSVKTSLPTDPAAAAVRSHAASGVGGAGEGDGPPGRVSGPNGPTGADAAALSVHQHYPTNSPRGAVRERDWNNALDALSLSHQAVNSDPHLVSLSRMAAEMLEGQFAAITIIRRDMWRCLTAHGFPDVPMTADKHDTICYYNMLFSPPNEVFHVEDASKDDRFKTIPFVATEKTSIKFYAGAPIRTANGVKLGNLCVFGERPRGLTPTEARLLANLAELAARQLEKDSLVARALGGEEAKTLRQLRAFEALGEPWLVVDTGKAGWPILHANSAAEQLLGSSNTMGASGFAFWSLFTAAPEEDGRPPAPAVQTEADWGQEAAAGATFMRRIARPFAGKTKVTANDPYEEFQAVFRPAGKAMDLSVKDVRSSTEGSGVPSRASASKGTAGLSLASPAGQATPLSAGGSSSMYMVQLEAAGADVQIIEPRDLAQMLTPMPQGLPPSLQPQASPPQGQPQQAAPPGAVSAGASSAALSTPADQRPPVISTGSLGSTMAERAVIEPQASLSNRSPYSVQASVRSATRASAQTLESLIAGGRIPTECRGAPAAQRDMLTCPLPSVRLLTRLSETQFTGLWAGSIVRVIACPLPDTVRHLSPAEVVVKLEPLRSRKFGHPLLAPFFSFAVGSMPQGQAQGKGEGASAAAAPALWATQDLCDSETLQDVLYAPDSFLNPPPRPALHTLVSMFSEVMGVLKFLRSRDAAHGFLDPHVINCTAMPGGGGAQAVLGGMYGVRVMLGVMGAEEASRNDAIAAAAALRDAIRRLTIRAESASVDLRPIDPMLSALKRGTEAVAAAAAAGGGTDLDDAAASLRLQVEDIRAAMDAEDDARGLGSAGSHSGPMSKLF